MLALRRHRLRAACALLTGAFRLSKAKAARLLGDLFGVPLSAAGVCATEAAVGEQLRPVADHLRAAAQGRPANVDETGMGKGRWLWVMVTAVATVFQSIDGSAFSALPAGCSPTATTQPSPATLPNALPPWTCRKGRVSSAHRR